MSVHDTYIVHKQSSCFWLTVAYSRLPIAVWCFTERITRKWTAAPPVSDSAASSWCSLLHTRISFQAQRLIVDSVWGPRFCSHIVNKGFFLLLFLIRGCPPPTLHSPTVCTLCLWKPSVVVRSLQLEPGWPVPPPPSPSPSPTARLKAGCRWKIYDCMPWKPLTFHLKCCSPSDAAPTDSDRVCRLHSTDAFPHSGGSDGGEWVGRRPRLHPPSPCSLITHTFLSVVDWSQTLVKRSWERLTANLPLHGSAAEFHSFFENFFCLLTFFNLHFKTWWMQTPKNGLEVLHLWLFYLFINNSKNKSAWKPLRWIGIQYN